MNFRVLLYLVVTTCLMAFLLVAITLDIPLSPGDIRLQPNHVRGSAVIYRGVEYTLNFKQQNQLIACINTATPDPIDKELLEPLEHSIVIYQFNQPDISIQFFRNGSGLFFFTPDWNHGNLYPFGKTTPYLSCVKALAIQRSKKGPYCNMDPFSIVKSRGFDALK